MDASVFDKSISVLGFISGFPSVGKKLACQLLDLAERDGRLMEPEPIEKHLLMDMHSLLIRSHPNSAATSPCRSSHLYQCEPPTTQTRVIGATPGEDYVDWSFRLFVRLVSGFLQSLARTRPQ